MPHTNFRQWLIAGALALTATAAVAASAEATAPGANGSIAFRRYFDAAQTVGAVFTIQPDGSGERQITTPPAATVDDQPDWAPDGSLITFTRCAANGPCHVYTVAPDGSGLTPVGAICAGTEQVCPDDSHASFSPDSQQLALIQSSGGVRTDAYTESWIEHSAIAVLKRDGTGRRVIYRGAPYSGDLDFPVFSPNGKQIVFERVSSSFTRRAGQRAVFVIGVDGTHLRRLTPWEEYDGDNPDWSPDGKWIVFHSYVDQDGKQSQLFRIHPDGSGRRQLTHFSGGTHVASTSFSPDGRWLAISKGIASRNVHLFALRLADGKVRRITHSPLWDSAPDWGPR